MFDHEIYMLTLAAVLVVFIVMAWYYERKLNAAEAALTATLNGRHNRADFDTPFGPLAAWGTVETGHPDLPGWQEPTYATPEWVDAVDRFGQGTYTGPVLVPDLDLDHDMFGHELPFNVLDTRPTYGD